MKATIGKVFRGGLWLTLAIAVAGTVVSFGIRDLTMQTGVLFYGTPWFLRLLAAAGLIGFTRKSKAMRWAGIAVAMVASFQGARSWQYKSPEPAPANAVTVAIWNAGHALHDRKPLWPVPGGNDLCAIVETGVFREGEWEGFIATMPDMQWRQLGEGMAIGVKGQILESKALHQPRADYRCFQVRVRVREQEFSAYVVDLRSEPWRFKKPQLEAILKVAGKDPRRIILGDFNTPTESRWLDEWRSADLQLANDAPRRGFRETWAYGLPILSLDQIWVGSAWQAHSVRKSGHGSDHSKVDAVLLPHPATF